MEVKDRKRTISALLLGLVGLLGIGFLFTLLVLVPRLYEFYKDHNLTLPAPTQFVIQLSDWLTNPSISIIGLCFLVPIIGVLIAKEFFMQSRRCLLINALIAGGLFLLICGVLTAIWLPPFTYHIDGTVN
ncbi:MAG: hypothetical protein ACYDBB_13305 [Armatimonadota bacterium]